MVLYFPSCNLITIFEHEIDGWILDCGVSDLLYLSSEMCGHQSETLRQHFTGKLLCGAPVAVDFVNLPDTIVEFDVSRQEHPDSQLWSRNTGASRNYGANPYLGCDEGGRRRKPTMGLRQQHSRSLPLADGMSSPGRSRA